MSEADEKRNLHLYLRNVRGVLLWKLEGLSDYDIRRPMTATGTNLLGLVKHCAGVECDGAAGLREGVSNMPPGAGAAAWKQHYAKLEQIARSKR